MKPTGWEFLGYKSSDLFGAHKFRRGNSEYDLWSESQLNDITSPVEKPGPQCGISSRIIDYLAHQEAWMDMSSLQLPREWKVDMTLIIDDVSHIPAGHFSV